MCIILMSVLNLLVGVLSFCNKAIIIPTPLFVHFAYRYSMTVVDAKKYRITMYDPWLMLSRHYIRKSNYF